MIIIDVLIDTFHQYLILNYKQSDLYSLLNPNNIDKTGLKIFVSKESDKKFVH